MFKIHRYLDRRLNKNFFPVTGYPDLRVANNRHRIIHFNGNFVVGGSSQLIADLIERTSGKYEHQVIIPTYPDFMGYTNIPLSRFTLDEMTALYEYLQKQRPALVHIHYWVRPVHRFTGFSLWYQAVFRICEELHLKVIQNINVPTKPYHSSAVKHNVFVSNYVRDEFNDSESASSVIYPGSDFTHFRNEEMDPVPGKVIGMVYRLDGDKLNAESIEVFIAAVKKDPAIKCLIAGEGWFSRHYRKRVKEEGLGSHFTFTGYVRYRDLPGCYKKMALFVAPVHDESFGQVIPFAMSMGLCVAGYATGALPEILGYEETLSASGNVDALSDLIVELVNNPDKRKRLGKRNRERAHRLFSVEQMIGAYEKIYNGHIAETA